MQFSRFVNAWVGTCASLLVGPGLFLGASQSTAAAEARDIKSGCQLSDLPALDPLTVSWSGECSQGRAQGVGSVYAFSGGELRYILRARFADGRLVRTEQLEDCRTAGVDCQSQVAPAVMQLHATTVRRSEVFPVVATTAAATPPSPPPPVPPLSGQAQGAGREIRATNATYRGDFVSGPRGLISGTGVVVYDDGQRYEGRLENGNKVGRGTFTWANGQSYAGDWRDGLPDGQGEWRLSGGDRYVGEVRQGKRQGKGTMYFGNQSVYTGEWSADQPSGQGSLRSANGDLYEGAFVAGDRTGVGTWTNREGDRYSGDWVRNKRAGHGIAEWKSGLRYEGDWLDDRRQGQGSMRFPDGSTYVGAWVSDQATGEGRIAFPSGDTYVGEVRDGVPQGKGIYRWGSGDQFVGVFDAGKPTSLGTMSFQTDGAPGRSASSPAEPEPAVAASSPAGAPAVSRATLCSKAYNAARTVQALRRFMENYPEDECARHSLAKQKIAALEVAERKQAKDQDERTEQARALIGGLVAYRQDFPYCVSGTGPSCQRVVYQFEVKGRIRDVNIPREGVQIQVTDVALMGADKGAADALVSEGRAAATTAFRSRMVGSTQFKGKTEVGLSF